MNQFVMKLIRPLYHPVTPFNRYPLRLLFGSVYIFTGQWADLYLPNGIITFSWKRGSRYAYFSKDGSDVDAVWKIGAIND